MFSLDTVDAVSGKQKWIIDVSRQVSRLTGAVVEFSAVPSSAIRRARNRQSVYFNHCTVVENGLKLRVFQTAVAEPYLYPLSCVELPAAAAAPCAYKVGIDEKQLLLYVVYIKGLPRRGLDTLIVKQYPLKLGERKSSQQGKFRPLKIDPLKRATEISVPEFASPNSKALARLLIHPNTGQIFIGCEMMVRAPSILFINQLHLLHTEKTTGRLTTVEPAGRVQSSRLSGNWDFSAQGSRLVGLYSPLNHRRTPIPHDKTVCSCQDSPQVIMWQFAPSNAAPLKGVKIIAAKELELGKALKDSLLSDYSGRPREAFAYNFDMWWQSMVSYGVFGKYLLYGPCMGSYEMDKIIFAIRSTGRFTERQTAVASVHVGNAIVELLTSKEQRTDMYDVKEQWLLPYGHLGVLVVATHARSMKWTTFLMRISLRKACQQRKCCSGCDRKFRLIKLRVCSVCKKKNLHRCWWKYPCHFCSTDCLRTNWRSHNEKLHKLPSLVFKQHPRADGRTGLDNAYENSYIALQFSET